MSYLSCRLMVNQATLQLYIEDCRHFSANNQVLEISLYCSAACKKYVVTVSHIQHLQLRPLPHLRVTAACVQGYMQGSLCLGCND